MKKASLLVLFVVGAVVFLTAHYAAAQAPFPQPEADPGGGITGGVAIPAARQAADAALDAINQFWGDLVNPGSPYWQQLLLGASPLLAISSLAWLAKFLIRWFKDRKGINLELMQKELVWPIVVLTLLLNNGTLLAGANFVPKAIIEEIDSGILDVSFAGIPNRNLIQLFNIRNGAQKYQQLQIKSCLGQAPEIRAECEAQAQERTQSFLEQAFDFIQGAVDFNPATFVQEQIFQVQAEIALVSILVSVTTAFRFVLALALAVWAMSSPLWISITMLPLKTRGLQVLASGYFGIGFATATHSLLVSATAASVALAPNADLLIPAIVMGAFSPLLALAIGGGSALGVFFGFVAAGGAIAKSGTAVFQKALF